MDSGLTVTVYRWRGEHTDTVQDRQTETRFIPAGARGTPTAIFDMLRDLRFYRWRGNTQ